MNASDLFKQGQLSQAIQAQIEVVRDNPADVNKRLFLFELLVFSGDIDRARKHIDLVRYDDLEVEASVNKYRALLDAENKRRQVFGQGIRPQFFGENVPEHVNLRLQAVQHLCLKQPVEAAEMLARANEAALALKGTLNDKPFDFLRDADDLFGTVIEVMALGNYFWVPLDQVENITLGAPRFPRDLIWAPARLDMGELGAGEVFLPVLYPHTHEQADDNIKLGRVTAYTDTEPVLGHGARVFLVGEEDVPLLDWRQLTLNRLEAPAKE